jgi:hypothetical protein
MSYKARLCYEHTEICQLGCLNGQDGRPQPCFSMSTWAYWLPVWDGLTRVHDKRASLSDEFRTAIDYMRSEKPC